MRTSARRPLVERAQRRTLHKMPSALLHLRRAVRNTPAADVAALRAFYEEYDAELVQLMDGEQKFAWSSAGVA